MFFISMKKKLVKMLLILVLLTIIIMVSIVKIKTSPVNKNGEEITIKVNDGDTYYSLVDTLYDKKLIKSKVIFKVYVKLFGKELLQGVHVLSQKMNMIELLDSLSKVDNSFVTVTFREGLNIRQIGQVIEDNLTFTKDEFISKVTNTEYINTLINKYDFLTNEVLNSKIYYPLEGYLYPDTYNISNSDTLENIIEMMLDNFNKKVGIYTSDKYTMHQLITLASIVELEAGNVTDRSKVAQVFYNRINKVGETLGSDITSYYGAKMDDWTNGLGSAEYACNGYNTRLQSKCPINGLPVGPVANPSIESITAVLKPDTTVDNTYLFFVSDCDGKIYLNKTYNQHLNTIQELKQEDNWCDN